MMGSADDRLAEEEEEDGRKPPCTGKEAQARDLHKAPDKGHICTC